MCDTTKSIFYLIQQIFIVSHVQSMGVSTGNLPEMNQYESFSLDLPIYEQKNPLISFADQYGNKIFTTGPVPFLLSWVSVPSSKNCRLIHQPVNCLTMKINCLMTSLLFPLNDFNYPCSQELWLTSVTEVRSTLLKKPWTFIFGVKPVKSCPHSWNRKEASSSLEYSPKATQGPKCFMYIISSNSDKKKYYEIGIIFTLSFRMRLNKIN